MKNIAQLLKKRTVGARAPLDEKSIFFVFGEVIKSEYGKQGAQNIELVSLRDRRIIVKIASPMWASEISLNKGQILRKTNEKIGMNELADIVLSK